MSLDWEGSKDKNGPQKNISIRFDKEIEKGVDITTLMLSRESGTVRLNIALGDQIADKSNIENLRLDIDDDSLPALISFFEMAIDLCQWRQAHVVSKTK